MKMIYQADPGPLPPPTPPDKAEMEEIARLLSESKARGEDIAADLLIRARLRFYNDPVFHARAIMAADIVEVEFQTRDKDLVPSIALRMAAAVGLLLAEEPTQEV